MLLSLSRFTMIVSLLISAVCIEANSDKLSFVPAEKSKAVAEANSENNALSRDDTMSIDSQDEESLVQKRETNREHDSRIRRVGSMENRIARSDGGLAHKMAKDALKSPKMQETMKKLTRVGSPRRKSFETAKLPAAAGKSTKKQRKQVNRKGRRKKKRKRHHRRYRNEHAGSSKRGSPKRASESRSDTDESLKKLDKTQNSILKRNQAVHTHKTPKRPSISKSKITAVKVDESDYVDFSTPLNTESSVHLTKTKKNENSVKLRESESMIERLMRTTTRDPSKKHPVDQGIEYSDYYSDDDVLQDIAANKIPINIAELRNSNDRFTRQTMNSTSFYSDNHIDQNAQPYYQDYDTRDKNFRYNDEPVNSLNNFQNVPSIERSSNSQVPGADDSSIGDVESSKPVEDRNENSEVYPVDNGESSVPEQPQMLEQVSVPDLQNNFEPSDSNAVNDAVQSENADQYNYLNQYEKPSGEQYQSLDTNEPQNMNFNQDTPPQIENLQNENLQVPQFSNQFSSGTQHTDNFEQNVMNSPEIEDMKEENLQSNFPVQVKNNYDHLNNVPSMNFPNAMDQPLGKVLESLGINVNADSSNTNQNVHSEENIRNNEHEKINNPAPSSETQNRPVEHIISPSYIKKKSKEDSSENQKEKSIKGSDHRVSKLEHENENLRGSHSRRHSAGNKIEDDNLLPYVDYVKTPTHNMNISIAVHDTKEVANQILDTIMEELQEIKLDKAKSDKREGSWSTAQAGMKLDMKVANRSINVTVSELTSPRFHESLLNGTWNVSGHAPFKRGAPFTLIATDNSTHTIAVFVGACRVCQGIDTIAGVWSVARQPNDCRDFQVATSVFNDIFRKTTWSSLKEKENGVAANQTDNTTVKTEKRKS